MAFDSRMNNVRKWINEQLNNTDDELFHMNLNK